MNDKQTVKSLLALALGTFGVGMSEFAIMGILPAVAKSMDFSIPKAGNFVSIYAIGVIFGQFSLPFVPSDSRSKEFYSHSWQCIHYRKFINRIHGRLSHHEYDTFHFRHTLWHIFRRRLSRY